MYMYIFKNSIYIYTFKSYVYEKWHSKYHHFIQIMYVKSKNKKFYFLANVDGYPKGMKPCLRLWFWEHGRGLTKEHTIFEGSRDSSLPPNWLFKLLTCSWGAYKDSPECLVRLELVLVNQNKESLPVAERKKRKWGFHPVKHSTKEKVAWNWRGN